MFTILESLSKLNFPVETKKKKKTKLRGHSPQADYTDRSTAACRKTCRLPSSGCLLLSCILVGFTWQRIVYPRIVSPWKRVYCAVA
jgi:hypothetical protein